MNEFIQRVKVIGQSIVTWAGVAILVLGVVSDEIVGLLPADMGGKVIGGIAVAVAVLTAIVKVIQRVTPVLPEARGILPPPSGEPVTKEERFLVNQLRKSGTANYAIILLVAGLIAVSVATFGGGQKAVASGACSSYATAAIVDGKTLYGRAGKCTSLNAPWKKWRLRVSCTGGNVYYTIWNPPTTINYGKLCPYPRIVSSYGFGFSTV